MFQTEFEFTLPCGFIDEDGELHREGIMRRATAADEILPLRDPRVQKNQAYLSIILLSRVIVRLGTLETITPKTIENLFATDMSWLQNMYNKINRLQEDHSSVNTSGHDALKPNGAEIGMAEGYGSGELSATPLNS